MAHVDDIKQIKELPAELQVRSLQAIFPVANRSRLNFPNRDKVRLADDSLGTARKRMATAARRGLKEFESMDYVYNPMD
jgi:hypothetical protein